MGCHFCDLGYKSLWLHVASKLSLLLFWFAYFVEARVRIREVHMARKWEVASSHLPARNWGPWYQVQANIFLLYNRPINRGAGTRNSDFIGKAIRPRRWLTSVPENHLTWVGIQASFISKSGEGVAGCCGFLGFGIICSCSCPNRLATMFL